MHCYQNLTVPSSATLTVTAKYSTSGTPQNVPIGALMAFVSGACTIAGTINAAAIITSNGNGGGAGGGGGGGSTIAGSNGADSDVFGSASVTRVAAGAFGGAIGQSGGNGTSPQPASQKAIWSKAPTLGSLGGSFGGKGGGIRAPTAAEVAAASFSYVVRSVSPALSTPAERTALRVAAESVAAAGAVAASSCLPRRIISLIAE